MEDLLRWYFDATPPINADVSETRDMFEARAQRIFPLLLKNGFSEQDASLIYSIIGEVGNNSFDHNLGLWTGQPGCYFHFEIDDRGVAFAIADHGRGLFSSLKRVLPTLKTDQEAIETAFEKTISGRAPEQRGNGLKFVQRIINGNPRRALVGHSGSGSIYFGGNASFIDLCKKLVGGRKATGMLVWTRWDRV
jgi:hypothetical protein